MDMIPRQYGENTTLETRHEAHESVDKAKRQQQILEILKHDKYTAREIANILYYSGKIPTPERNYVSPRLTELMDQGKVEPVGKIQDKWTGRMVAVFALRKEE